MDDLDWCRSRRDALLEELFKEATTLEPTKHGVHNGRVDALRVFDKRIAELEV
jgi:hypothetical protein